MPIQVQVQVCYNCSKHSFLHSPDLYDSFYKQLQQALLQEDVQGITLHRKNGKLGSFQVNVGEVVIFSRLNEKKLPNAQFLKEVLKKMQQQYHINQKSVFNFKNSYFLGRFRPKITPQAEQTHVLQNFVLFLSKENLFQGSFKIKVQAGLNQSRSTQQADCSGKITFFRGRIPMDFKEKDFSISLVNNQQKVQFSKKISWLELIQQWGCKYLEIKLKGACKTVIFFKYRKRSCRQMPDNQILYNQFQYIQTDSLDSYIKSKEKFQFKNKIRIPKERQKKCTKCKEMEEILNKNKELIQKMQSLNELTLEVQTLRTKQAELDRKEQSMRAIQAELDMKEQSMKQAELERKELSMKQAELDAVIKQKDIKIQQLKLQNHNLNQQVRSVKKQLADSKASLLLQKNLENQKSQEIKDPQLLQQSMQSEKRLRQQVLDYKAKVSQLQKQLNTVIQGQLQRRVQRESQEKKQEKLNEQIMKTSQPLILPIRFRLNVQLIYRHQRPNTQKYMKIIGSKSKTISPVVLQNSFPQFQLCFSQPQQNFSLEVAQYHSNNRIYGSANLQLKERINSKHTFPLQRSSFQECTTQLSIASECINCLDSRLQTQQQTQIQVQIASLRFTQQEIHPVDIILVKPSNSNFCVLKGMPLQIVVFHIKNQKLFGRCVFRMRDLRGEESKKYFPVVLKREYQQKKEKKQTLLQRGFLEVEYRGKERRKYNFIIYGFLVIDMTNTSKVKIHQGRNKTKPKQGKIIEWNQEIDLKNKYFNDQVAIQVSKDSDSNIQMENIIRLEKVKAGQAKEFRFQSERGLSLQLSVVRIEADQAQSQFSIGLNYFQLQFLKDNMQIVNLSLQIKIQVQQQVSSIGVMGEGVLKGNSIKWNQQYAFKTKRARGNLIFLAFAKSKKSRPGDVGQPIRAIVYIRDFSQQTTRKSVVLKLENGTQICCLNFNCRRARLID